MPSAPTPKAPRLLFWGAAAAAAIAAIPLVYLAIRITGSGIDSILEVLSRGRTWETAGTSLGLALTVIIASLAISYPTALILTRVQVPFPRSFFTLAVLPLAIPSYVAAYAWLAQFPAMSGFWAAALILTLVSFPYTFLPIIVSLRTSDHSLEQVARSLGRTPITAFLATSFRQSTPAAAAGSLLIGLYVLSDFGVVALFRVDTFTRVIYSSYRASFDKTSAAVLAGILVLLAIILISLERKARGRTLRYRPDRGVANSLSRLTSTRGIRSASVTWLTGLATTSLLIPTASLFILMSEGTRALDWGELTTAVVNTVVVSFVGAVIAVGLALPIAALTSRFRNRKSAAIESLSYSGLALPGVVIGLSLVFLSINVFPAIYQSFFLLAFAYAVLFLPKSLGASRSAFESTPPVLEQVARSLGEKPMSAWMFTTGRLSLTGVAAGGLLVMLTSMKELPATLMLRPTGFETLATELWNRTELAAYGAAVPYALALIAVAAIPAFLLSKAILVTKSEEKRPTEISISA
jgi:iron(III) transport system permease protein